MALNILISSRWGTAWTAMQSRARASRSEHGDEAGHEHRSGQRPMASRLSRAASKAPWLWWAPARCPYSVTLSRIAAVRSARQRASAVSEHSLATCRCLPLYTPANRRAAAHQ
jgi:hypothetical protein